MLAYLTSAPLGPSLRRDLSGLTALGFPKIAAIGSDSWGKIKSGFRSICATKPSYAMKGFASLQVSLVGLFTSPEQPLTVSRNSALGAFDVGPACQLTLTL